MEKMLICNNDNNYLIMGDLNGHTNETEDFVLDQNDNHSPVNNNLYHKDIYLSRNNQDKKVVNQHGKMIIDLCKIAQYRILNGRTPGDTLGRYTRYPGNMRETPSVIDYAICSTKLMEHIHSFSVLPYTGITDHCCISTNIKVNTVDQNSTVKAHNEISHAHNEIFHSIEVKYTYDKNQKATFEKYMASDANLIKLKHSLSQNNDISQDIINEAVDILNTVLTTAARKAFLVKKVKNKNKGNDNRKDWYKKSCKGYRNKFRQCSKKLSKDPFNKLLLNNFLQARAEYKRVCRKAEKHYRHSLITKLLRLENNDPKSFWGIIKKMNSWGNIKQDPCDNISPHKWRTHFEELLNCREMRRNRFFENEIKTFDPLLDGHISEDELKVAINKLKCNKAPGPDGIFAKRL